MNKDGKLTDVTGNPLAVGFQVTLMASYECCPPDGTVMVNGRPVLTASNPGHGVGTVEVVHTSGDNEGCVSVVWRKGGRRCLVPDTALKIVAKRLPFAKPVELQAFALFLRARWNVQFVDDDAVARAVAAYVVARMEVPES